MIEDELKLMDIQQELDLLIGKKFYMGTSISDTIYYAIIHGQVSGFSVVPILFRTKKHLKLNPNLKSQISDIGG